MAGVDLWTRTHHDVLSLWTSGASEYVGARCCAMNGVTACLSLAAEVSSKFLEIALRLDESRQALDEGAMGNVEKLLVEAMRRGITGISEFQPTLAKLRAIVDRRRPATFRGAPRTREALTTDLGQIDELIFTLLDRINAPDEFKFSLPPYLTLFEMGRDAAWLKMRNQAFETRREHLQSRYVEVNLHLHGQAPKGMPVVAPPEPAQRIPASLHVRRPPGR